MKNKKFLAMLVVGALLLTGVQATIADTVAQSNSENVVFGKPNNKIVINADTDFDGDHEIPVIAKVGQKLGIHLNQEGYKLSVVGENGAKIQGSKFEKDKNHKPKDCKKCKDGKNKYYTWTPGEPGIFTIQVTQGQNNGNKDVLASRKIYVNDSAMITGKYYQLKGVGFKINEKTVALDNEWLANEVTTGSAYGIDFGDESTTSSAYAVKKEEEVIFGTQIYKTSESTPKVEFTIGEEGFWKRTPINYAKLGGDTYYIKEGEHFNLDKGTYNFWASVKHKKSIEAEDFMKDTYTRRDAEHQVTLELVDQGGSSLKAEASCTGGEACDFEYAMLVKDELSSKVVQDYSTNNNLPYGDYDRPWKQTLEVRAKHVQKDAGDKLPNAYEARVFKEIGTNPHAQMIDEVEITPSSVEAYYNGKKGKQDEQKIEFNNGQPNKVPYVLANNKNYIEIEIEEDEKRHKEKGYTYQYKAWVVDSGVTIPLEAYDLDDDDQDEAKFVYYPKSGGNFQGMDEELAAEQHKLIVEVTRFTSGGVPDAKEQREITLEVRTTK